MTRSHGTYAAYVVDHCRCDQCRAERSAWTRRRHYAVVNGTWQPYTNTKVVRWHLDKLRADGYGTRTIARLAGVSRTAIARAYQRKHIRRTTAAKILAVRPPAQRPALADGALIDAAPTVQRLQALAALGWPQTTLSRYHGHHVSNYMHRDRVTVRNAKAIAALYQRLHMTPGPSTAARRRARARGWQPPLALPDDE